MLNDLKLSRRRVLATGSAFAATALLAACGEADEDPAENGGSGQPGASPTPEPDPSPTQDPGDAQPIFATEGEAAVISVSYEGGFMAVEDIVRQTPIVSLFNDGQLVYPGPIPEIYPEPAAPNLLVTTLSDLGIQAVGEQVLETGLFEDGDKQFDSSAAILADAAHTVFTVRLAGQDPVRVSAYALEFDSDETGLDEEELAARRKLRDLLNYISGAPTGFPTDHIAEQETSYELERLEIIPYPWSEMPVDFEELPDPTPWPLEEGPGTIGEPFVFPGHNARCAVLAGDDLDAMLATLREATVLSRWEHLGDSFALINRPLLPGQEGCVNPFTGTDDPPVAGDYSYPEGEDELVVRYELLGGFVPLEWHVTNMPVNSLFGDGRMISQGAQIMIYPPPALPALVAERLTPEGIRMILAEADAAGMLQGEQDWDDLTQFVADAGTGVLTIHANGEMHRVSVYAPGMFDVGDMVSDEEVAFREQFDAFVQKLTDLSSWLPEDVFLDVQDDYPVDRLQIVTQPASVLPAPEDVQPNELDWPLDDQLAAIGEPYAVLEMSRCFILAGDDFATVMSALNDATTITRWTQRVPPGGEQFVLYIRPLLPDEEGCQDPFA